MKRSALDANWFCREVKTIHLRNVCPNDIEDWELVPYSGELVVGGDVLAHLSDPYAPPTCNPTWGVNLTSPVVPPALSTLTELMVRLLNRNTGTIVAEFVIDLTKFFRIGSGSKLSEMKALPTNSLFFATDGGTALYTTEKIYIKLRSAGLIPMYSKDKDDSLLNSDEENADTAQQITSLAERIQTARSNLRQMHDLFDERLLAAHTVPHSVAVALVNKAAGAVGDDVSSTKSGKSKSLSKLFSGKSGSGKSSASSGGGNVSAEAVASAGPAGAVASSGGSGVIPADIPPGPTAVATPSALQIMQQLEYDRLSAEIAAVEEENAREAALLEQEEGRYASLVQSLNPLMAACQEEQTEIEEQLQPALETLREELIGTKFMLEARQLKLLSELQCIYPIEQLDISNSSDFAIRGIELSTKDTTTARDDEQVAAALGYVVHTMLLLSKYLETPLRYQLVYQASRSMIRDAVSGGLPSSSVTSGGGLVLPLYRRNVDRDRYERGLIWLQRDVEQLLACRGIGYDYKKDILCNLQQIFVCEMCPGMST